MVQIEIGGRLSVPRAGALPAINPDALAAQRLVAAGAIMTVPEPRLEQNLVGYLEWLGPQRLFWFTAYGESLADAHLLEFDALRVADDGSVTFSNGGQLVSSLTCIERANVADPDDYRIAWQLWQEVAPLRRRLIESCCAALTREAPLVDGIDGQRFLRGVLALKARRSSRA